MCVHFPCRNLLSMLFPNHGRQGFVSTRQVLVDTLAVSATEETSSETLGQRRRLQRDVEFVSELDGRTSVSVQPVGILREDRLLEC